MSITDYIADVTANLTEWGTERAALVEDWAPESPHPRDQH